MAMAMEITLHNPGSSSSSNYETALVDAASSPSSQSSYDAIPLSVPQNSSPVFSSAMGSTLPFLNSSSFLEKSVCCTPSSNDLASSQGISFRPRPYSYETFAKQANLSEDRALAVLEALPPLVRKYFPDLDSTWAKQPSQVKDRVIFLLKSELGDGDWKRHAVIDRMGTAFNNRRSMVMRAIFAGKPRPFWCSEKAWNGLLLKCLNSEISNSRSVEMAHPSSHAPVVTLPFASVVQ